MYKFTHLKYMYMYIVYKYRNMYYIHAPYYLYMCCVHSYSANKSA